jgi:hypothetical protein
MQIFYHVSGRTIWMAEAKATPPDTFERGKRLLVLACGAIIGGLAVAGSVDRATGGVILLAGWLMGLAALHRVGRSGPDRSERV